MEKREFTRSEREQIEAGRKEGLDVSIYAKTEYTAMHMQQIRMGLLEGLPVEKYANPAYDWLQMEEIRKGLLEKVDTGLYASPQIPYEKMRQMRKGLKEGIDLTPFLELDAGILRQFRKAVEAKVSIIPYATGGYETEQLEEIRKALERHLDIHPYLSKEFLGAAIHEIAKGLEDGLDVSVYASPEYGWQQMREIRLGLEHRVQVSTYVNPYFSWQQMREIRLGLEAGLDVSRYATLMYTASDMRRKRQEQTEKTAKKESHRAPEPVRTKNLSITVSDDEMEAYVICETDAGLLTYEDIKDALGRWGIVHGVDDAAIKNILEGRTRIADPVLVAKGTPPQDGRDGWYEYFFRTEPERTPKLLEDGSVDYQDIDWFEVVEENQKVAYYHEAGEGTNGVSVTGKPLLAHKGKEQNLLRGQGYRLLEDGKTYVSAINGRIELRGNQLLITRLFIFSEVTMATGNVDVDGSVYIKGNVGSRTVIKATEDIVVEGFIESAYLSCGGNIFLKQGMNASGDGTLTAVGDVIGRFFEAVSIRAGGNVKANYAMNCKIRAEGKLLISGKKGVLIGGEFYAAQGIRVYHLGSRSGVHTSVKVGVSDKTLGQAWQNGVKINDVNKELTLLRTAYLDMQKKFAPEVRNTMETYLKIENAIYTKEQELANLEAERTQLGEKSRVAKEAVVVVSGKLYEGVEFEINELKWISSEARNVRIKKVGNRVAMYAN